MEKPKRSTSNKNSKHDKSRQVRDTADVVAVVRYHESKKKKPLVNDPFAYLFASPQGEAILESALKRWPFFAEYLVVRAKFFDDALKNYCSKDLSLFFGKQLLCIDQVNTPQYHDDP